MKNSLEKIARSDAHLDAFCRLMIETGDEIRVTVSTGSMSPLIPAGSQVTIRCEPLEAREGTPVAYLSGSELIIHRLLRIHRDSLGHPTSILCRGDASRRDDPPAPWTALVGVVVSVSPPSLTMRLKLMWWSLLRKLRNRA